MSTASQRGIPLRPDYPAATHMRRAEALRALTRSCVAIGAAVFGDNVSPERLARSRYPGDTTTRDLLELVAKGAVAPSDTSAVVKTTVMRDVVAALSGACAAASLINLAMRLDFDRASKILVPGFVASGSGASFVAENAAIPSRRLGLSNPSAIEPHKISAIVALTREMIEASNAEVLVQDALTRSISLALDDALFGVAAASAAQPAGLRFGIAGLTASTGGSDSQDAFLADLGAVVDAIEPVAGNAPVIFVAKPSRALKMLVHFMRDVERAVVLASSGATIDDAFIAIVPATVAAAGGGVPEISATRVASLHVDDAAGPIDGSAPVRSLFQTDAVALKLRLPISWTLRDPRGVAWLVPGKW
jgi:hypothetical protein